MRFDDIIKEASDILSEKIQCPPDQLVQGFMQGTKIGATPVSHGAALPHMRLHHIIEPLILIVRAQTPVNVDMGEGFWGDFAPDEPIHAIFFLISPEENPGQHLRILAKLAAHIDDEHFLNSWKNATNEQALKELLLRDERFISLKISERKKSRTLIGKMLKDIEMPEESLIAIIHRHGKTIVPKANKILKAGDKITVIGDKKGLHDFHNLYGNE